MFKRNRGLVFIGSAAIAALLIYVVAHDVAAFCNSSIRAVSWPTAGVLGVAWTVATIWDVLTFWR